ncbi:MAG TPA: histidine ammonia-lyase [Terriglobia bacterium]|nr:histidine ammonia-lyase [Terriglobia bacterium]
MDPLQIDGQTLTIDDVHQVAAARRRVVLAPEAAERMSRSRQVIEAIVREGRAVYGVSTGFGKLADVHIGSDQITPLQHNLVRSHAAGLGDPFTEEETRALMLLRANVLAKGLSGARPIVAERLCDLLNHDVYPVIPCRGSVGASGDLAPLAHLALVLIGEGEVVQGGARVGGRVALDAIGAPPLDLQAKEGLALLNGTQATLATGVLSWRRAKRLVDLADLAGAMSLEALKGSPVAFDARVHQARPHPGQIEVAERLSRFLGESEIRQSHMNCGRIQDAYSLRCMPQVHGPARECLEYARGVAAIEINSATDNPLVFDENAILSAGNFHGQPLGLALDFLAISLTVLANISERRIERLLNPEYGDLPPFLADHPGLNSGFMIAQVAAAALASENKVLSHPASVDSIPTSGNREDHVPMAMGAALKLKQVVANLERVLAIEFLCGAQGIDYLRPLKAGVAVEAAYQRIRERIPHVAEDRVLATDMERMMEIMKNDAFVNLAS